MFLLIDRARIAAEQLQKDAVIQSQLTMPVDSSMRYSGSSLEGSWCDLGA